MRSNLFKWITWIVIGFALAAGFAARAAGNSNRYSPSLHKYNKNEHLVICRQIKDIEGDNRLGNLDYASYEACIASKEYKRFVGIWEKGNKKKGQENPYLKHIKGDVKSMELDPIADKYIHKYIDYFEAKTNVVVNRKKIFFGSIKGTAVGMCFYNYDVVVIDKTYWNTIPSVYTKELLIYHELGHCIMKRPHTQKWNKVFKGETKKCPNSIMYPHVFSSKDAYRCFNKNRDYYFAELTNPPPPEFSLGVQVYEWDSKNKKWKTKPLIANVVNGQSFKVKEYSCSVVRYGLSKKPDKYGYLSEYSKLICSKDSINYIGLTHSVYYYSGKDNYRIGWAESTLWSSSLRLYDSILKELIHIKLKFKLK